MGRDYLELFDMKRKKILYNPWLCHQPVITFPSMGNAYIHRSNSIPMSFQSTILALEQPTPFNDIFTSTSRAYTTGPSFIDEGGLDTIILCGILEPINEIFMAPEVIDHGVGLFTHRAIVSDVCKVSGHDLTNIMFDTFLHKTIDELVHRISMPSGSDSIELPHSLRSPSIIGFLESGLIFGNFFIPVPPIAQHLIPTVGYRDFSTFDNSGDRATNPDIDIGSSMPTWLTYRFSLHRLMGDPSLSVIDEFQCSLLTTPSGFAFDPTFELEREDNLSPLDFVTIAADDIDERQFPGIPVFPVSRRGYLSNMGWELAFDFELEQGEERTPCVDIFPDDLLCCSTSNPAFELVTEILGLPINFTIEKALPTPVIELIPERGTANGSIHYNIGMLEYYLESVTPFHVSDYIFLIDYKSIALYLRGGI